MLMASDIRLALDASLIGERVGLTLDAWQAQLLTERPRRALLLCSRQAGKSTVTALMALHAAIYDPGLILLLSPSQRQSQELFRLVLLFHAKLADAPELVAESALRAEMANGSRIIALPGSERTTRGYAAAKLVVIDEAARVDDALMAAIRPTLGVSDGSLIALTTPAGRRGWFYEAWIGDDSWHRVKVAASACPRLSAAFLAEELRELGPMMFKQEYELEFVDDAEAVFNTMIVAAAFSDAVRSLW